VVTGWRKGLRSSPDAAISLHSRLRRIRQEHSLLAPSVDRDGDRFGRSTEAHRRLWPGRQSREDAPQGYFHHCRQAASVGRSGQPMQRRARQKKSGIAVPRRKDPTPTWRAIPAAASSIWAAGNQLVIASEEDGCSTCTRFPRTAETEAAHSGRLRSRTMVVPAGQENVLFNSNCNEHRSPASWEPSISPGIVPSNGRAAMD